MRESRRKLKKLENSTHLAEDAKEMNVIVKDDVSVPGFEPSHTNQGRERAFCISIGATKHERGTKRLSREVKAGSAARNFGEAY